MTAPRIFESNFIQSGQKMPKLNQVSRAVFVSVEKNSDDWSISQEMHGVAPDSDPSPTEWA